MKKDKEIIEQVMSLENNSSSDLRKQKLSSLDLQGKNFTGSDCSGSSFMMSNLAGCDFSNCNLTDTSFLFANIPFIILEGAHRNGYQILRHAFISIDGKSAYGFLCQGKDKQVVLINEGNIKESEYKQSNATFMGILLYQLLMSNNEKS